jgi:hypothetical protein
MKNILGEISNDLASTTWQGEKKTWRVEGFPPEIPDYWPMAQELRTMLAWMFHKRLLGIFWSGDSLWSSGWKARYAW